MKGIQGFSSPSVLAAPNTVPILVWDECTFSSAAEVRICLSSEPAKPEAPSPKYSCYVVASVVTILTFVAIAAAIAVPVGFLSTRTIDDALQVRVAGDAKELGTRRLRVAVGLMVTPAGMANPGSGGAACVGDRPAEDFGSIIEDAFLSTLSALGAPGVQASLPDVACDSVTQTVVSTFTIEVQGADLAAAVARALETTEAEQRLASQLLDKLDLGPGLVVSQLSVDQSDGLGSA
ncbi:hypothetical protein PLESTM_001606300 [Pleodorina starrii]|nr:hypothetical protein PLESTM_001606300 [Pleodorina starrii]